jgi:nuclear pore complex protein Nup93
MLARNKNYAQVVEALNKFRLDKKSCEPLSAFQNVAQHLDRGDVAHHQIIKCWRLLQILVGEQQQQNSAGGAGGFGRGLVETKERVHATAYRAQEEGAGLSEEAVQFRKMLIAGGKQFLQENHWEYVQQVVTQHRIQVGGFPTVHVIIDAYIDLKFQKHGSWQPQHSLEIYDGKAPWAHIYYLLRCGLRAEAYQYAAEFSARLAGTVDAKFFSCFQEYLDEGRLSTNLRNQLLDEWNSRIRQTLIPDPTTGRLLGDPFKAALYKIIGRCEMSSKIIKSADVAPSIEDYLWLQLNLIQEDLRNDDFLQDRYTLRDMARNMLRFGANHFSPQGKTPHVYFLVLLLCGEFERAVAHIITHDHLSVDAIHFAIALAYYGVLRVPDNPHMGDGFELLSVRNADSAVPGSSVYELAYFQFARMIYYYSRQFFKTDPVDAMHYISLIGLYGGELGGQGSLAASIGAGKNMVEKEYTRITHSHLRELLLESGIPLKLVGESHADGLRAPGELERYGPLNFLNSYGDVVARIFKPAAEEADRRGKFTEAIQLYDLSGEYDTVVGILCKQLGEVVASHRAPLDLGDPLFPGSKSGISGFGLSSTTSNSAAAMTAAAAANDTIAARAMEVLEHYRSQPSINSKISESKRQTCTLLIRLYQFMKDVDGGRAEVALDSLRASGIVPLDPDMGTITRHAETFRSLDDSVARSLPQVLVMAMTTLAGLHRSLKEGRYIDPARQARMQEIRAQARAIILFAGSIQYRIPSDTFAKLNRLDVMMG